MRAASTSRLSCEATAWSTVAPLSTSVLKPSSRTTKCGSSSAIIAFVAGGMMAAKRLRAPSSDDALFIKAPMSAGPQSETTRCADSGARPMRPAICCKTLSVKAPCTIRLRLMLIENASLKVES